MFTLRRLLLACLVVVLPACGARPPAQPKPAAPAQADAPASSTIKPALIGKWRLVADANKDKDKDKDKDARIDWGFRFMTIDRSKGLILKFERRGDAVSFIKEGQRAGLVVPCRMIGDSSLELSQIVLGPEKLIVKRVQFELAGDTLKLKDDQGHVETCERVPVVVERIKIAGLPLYCEKCPEGLVAGLEKVTGISDLAADWKNRTVSLRLKDGEYRTDVLAAIARAGMNGQLEVNGKKLATWRPATPVKKSPGPFKELLFGKVHACCPECQNVIVERCKGNTVAFEGEGRTKDVRITGANLDPRAIIWALWDAGFKVP